MTFDPRFWGLQVGSTTLVVWVFGLGGGGGGGWGGGAHTSDVIVV